MGFSFFRSKTEWHRISCDYLLCRCYTQLWFSTRCKPEMKSRSSLVCGAGICEEQLIFWLSGHAKWREQRKSSSLLPAGIRQPRCDAPGFPRPLLCCCLYFCHLPGVRAVWVWVFVAFFFVPSHCGFPPRLAEVCCEMAAALFHSLNLSVGGKSYGQE